MSSTERAEELALDIEEESQLQRSMRHRQMNVTIDSQSAQQEKLIRLRRTKSGALAAVTAKRNEIERLMESPDNFQLAEHGASILTQLFQRYLDAQKKFLVEITDEDYKRKVILDFDETIKHMSEFEQKLKDWLIHAEANIHEEDI